MNHIKMHAFIFISFFCLKNFGLFEILFIQLYSDFILRWNKISQFSKFYTFDLFDGRNECCRTDVKLQYDGIMLIITSSKIETSICVMWLLQKLKSCWNIVSWIPPSHVHTSQLFNAHRMIGFPENLFTNSGIHC